MPKLKTKDADVCACAKLLLMSCYCYFSDYKPKMSTYTGVSYTVDIAKPIENMENKSRLDSLMRNLPYNNPARIFFYLFDGCDFQTKQKAIMHIMAVLGTVRAVYVHKEKESECTDQILSA